MDIKSRPWITAWLLSWFARLTVLVVFAYASPVAGQVVRGAVVTKASGSPVAGALAVLLDTAGRRVAVGLTGPDGRFELSAPAPGRYQLAAERIGYATGYTPFFELAAGATVTRTIAASIQPVSLGAIKVTARARCERQRDAPADVQRLWTEARKALTSVSLTEDAPNVSFRSVLWDRDLDPKTGSIRAETRRQVWAMGDYPFRSPPAPVLLAHGFVRGSVADTITYDAPDAHVLLSDAFLDGYCFSAVWGDNGLVGLAFEPVPDGPDRPGVKGTLWLDTATAELRRIEYGYVNLPFRTWPAHPGGDMDLRRLPDGAWIVSSWTIRMPRFAQRESVTIDSVAYVHESGGRVLAVQATGAPEEVATPVGTVRGTVTSESGVPLPRILVYLSGTSHAGTTDAEGEFAMPDVWTGRYELAWYDPARDPTAKHVTPRSLAVHEGDNRLTIHVPGMDAVVFEGCPVVDRLPGLGVVAGVVRERQTNVALGGVKVRATAASGERWETVTDGTGCFRFCWLPAGVFTLDAELSGFGAVRTLARVDSGGIARPELELGVAAVAAHGHKTLPARITGKVIDAGTGEPLAGVTVHLRGTRWRRVSDDSGRFAFDEVPAGDVTLEASRPGYAEATGTVAASRGQVLQLELRMATRPIELEPIVVTGVQTERAGLLADVQYRIRRGLGTFVQRQDIATRQPRYISEMLPITAFEVAHDQTLFNRRARCAPQVYLDGIRITHRARSQRGASEEAARALDLVNPASVETVEIYKGASEVPPEFGGSTARCGVIVIWTRRGLPPEPPDTSRAGGGQSGR